MNHSYYDCQHKKADEEIVGFLGDITCMACMDRELAAYPMNSFVIKCRDNLILKSLVKIEAIKNTSACECGAAKCRTTHASWCPEYKK